MGLVNKIGKFATKFRKDASGQFAVITAMVGLPILLTAATAVDINRAHTRDTGVRSAIDSAALAAVIPANMSTSERYAYAQSVFDNNYFGKQQVSLNIYGNRERIDIVANTQVPTLISGVVGMDYVDVQEETAAVLTLSDVVCVLVLDPVGDRALEFKDKTVFNSPACSVQVNSTSPFAMISGVVKPPQASSFCTTGISEGVFFPLVKHACTPIEDPYKNLVVPNEPKGKCGPKVVKEKTYLNPGVYCEGLKIDGAKVVFNPGIYHIKGELSFSSTAHVEGEGVTFILKGEGSSLKLYNNAHVNIKAPATGVSAGLAFWQVADAKNPNKQSGKSEISAGAGLKIVGTAYFPTHELVITSNSHIASQSPATSFIAFRLMFAGKSHVKINVDHEAGGIPPLLPRSDDGARLVR